MSDCFLTDIFMKTYFDLLMVMQFADKIGTGCMEEQSIPLSVVVCCVGSMSPRARHTHTHKVSDMSVIKLTACLSVIKIVLVL